MPLAELLYSDVYEGLTKNVQAGFYFGMSEVDGVPCHHLVFVQESIDWQVWIEDRNEFDRAFAACMEGKGYTVR